MNGHFNKRGRNQRRRQGVNPNRALDSNGPDVRIRGTAQQIYDKYQALARDAQSSGDRVKAENYLQHAEHYFRVLRSAQGPQAPSADSSATDIDSDSEQPSIGDAREQRQPTAADSDDGEEAPAKAQPNGSAENDGDDEAKADKRAQAGDQERRPRRRRPRRTRDEAANADEDVEPASA